MRAASAIHLRTRRASWRVLVCALAAMACTSTNQTGNNGNGVKSEGDTVYSLDLSKTSVVQPIASGEMIAQGFKFVQIEVTSVVNPKKHSLAFQVDYQAQGKERIHLGSFSLYPADMPGKFIVPTQGKVQDGGTLVLSMVSPDSVARGDTVKVSVKRLTFLKG